jgi:hypothetical protein
MWISVDLSAESTLKPNPLAKTDASIKQNTKLNTKASSQKRVSGNCLESPFGNTLQNKLRQYLGSAAWLSREMSEQFSTCIHRLKPLVTVVRDACVVKSVFVAVFKVKG